MKCFKTSKSNLATSLKKVELERLIIDDMRVLKEHMEQAVKVEQRILNRLEEYKKVK